MLTIKVEASAGSTIKESFIDAISMSQKLECFIEFDFNGILCVAHPKGVADKGAEGYHIAIKSNSKIKMAMS